MPIVIFIVQVIKCHNISFDDYVDYRALTKVSMLVWNFFLIYCVCVYILYIIYIYTLPFIELVANKINLLTAMCISSQCVRVDFIYSYEQHEIKYKNNTPYILIPNTCLK